MKIRTQRWLAFQYTLSGFGERETFISTLGAEQPFLPCTQHPFFESAIWAIIMICARDPAAAAFTYYKSLFKINLYIERWDDWTLSCSAHLHYMREKGPRFYFSILSLAHSARYMAKNSLCAGTWCIHTLYVMHPFCEQYIWRWLFLKLAPYYSAYCVCVC